MGRRTALGVWVRPPDVTTMDWERFLRFCSLAAASAFSVTWASARYTSLSSMRNELRRWGPPFSAPKPRTCLPRSCRIHGCLRISSMVMRRETSTVSMELMRSLASGVSLM